MKKIFAALFMGIALLLTPMQVSAAGGCPPDTVIAIPAWYKGMQDSTCNFEPKKGGDGKVDFVKTAILVGMNVLQAAFVIAGYVTVIMIIRGGFAYMLSTGSPDGMSKAKKSITNAVVGLIIAVLAASIVNAVAGLIS